MDGNNLGIIFDNLAKLDGRQSHGCEQKIYQLSLLSAILADKYRTFIPDFDVQSALSLLSEDLRLVHSPFPETLPENQPRAQLYSHLRDVADKTVFTELFVNELIRADNPITEGDFFSPLPIGDRVAYVKNALSDEAFEAFSVEYPNLALTYVKQFKDGVKDLLDGKVSYVLLPLEEKDGTRLSSVEELVDSCDLKIVSVTPVFGFDGEANVKYALFSTEAVCTPYASGDDRYLEVRLPFPAAGELFSVAAYFGIKTEKFQTVKRADDTAYVGAVLETEGKSFLPVLVYLSLFVPDFSLVGVYKNLLS